VDGIECRLSPVGKRLLQGVCQSFCLSVHRQQSWLLRLRRHGLQAVLSPERVDSSAVLRGAPTPLTHSLAEGAAAMQINEKRKFSENMGNYLIVSPVDFMHHGAQ